MSRELYVIMTTDRWNSYFVLDITSGPRTPAEVERTIAWQVTGGAERSDMKACRYRFDDNCFVPIDGSKALPMPADRSIYTEEAWSRFQASLHPNRHGTFIPVKLADTLASGAKMWAEVEGDYLVFYKRENGKPVEAGRTMLEDGEWAARHSVERILSRDV